MTTKLRKGDKVRDCWWAHITGKVVRVTTRLVYISTGEEVLTYDHTHANQFLLKIS